MRNLVYFAIMGQLHKHFMRAFLVQNCFLQLFSDYSLAFVTFWPKDIGTKAACKMLIKFTTWVNFNNLFYILQSRDVTTHIVWCRQRLSVSQTKQFPTFSPSSSSILGESSFDL
jgi:hypothetical protein